ncbi:hypothetical protein BD289DRAFT_455301 [Coniella lustricola]|uniref:SEC7 domain-containing protein n=1 Tax=Coniella lustricola TaxID=2025994 RepID=A0A2T3A0E9_9PEZI|nr:hypothetical protein BD289DRAFT_455301 [Coniella lustricola]
MPSPPGTGTCTGTGIGMPLSGSQQPQSKAMHKRRRTRPELNVDTFGANAYARVRSLDYDNAGLTIPLSPAPPSHLQPPTIPCKSSKRSIKSPVLPTTASTANTSSSSSSHQDDDAAAPPPPLPQETRRHPEARSRGDDGASILSSTDSTDSFAYKYERNACHRPPSTEPSSGRDPAEKRVRARDSTGDSQTFFDAFSDTLSDVDDMPYHEHDASPLRRRASRTSPSSDAHERTLRDSHDLSLSPRNVTRDSLLGNMLLSLDQFNLDQATSFHSGDLNITRSMSGFAGPHPSFRYDDVGGSPRAMTASGEGTGAGTLAGNMSMMSASSRARNTFHAGAGAAGLGGPRHGYSYSSDYDAKDEEVSRVSSNTSRGRRSNSFSAVANPARLREIATNQRPTGASGTGSRALHSRGGLGSKSSSTSSIDAAGYAHVLGSQKWTAHGIGAPKRSSSLELARRQSYGMQPPGQQQHPSQQYQPWHIERPNAFHELSATSFAHDYNHDHHRHTFDYDLDDAAPTPTVPGGPRRLVTMPSLPTFARHDPLGEPLSPVRSVNLRLDRKRSNKSMRNTNAAKHNAPLPPPPPPLLAASSSRREASQHDAHNAQLASLPSAGAGAALDANLLPSSDGDPAPAPNVGYEKAKEPVHAPPAVPVSAASLPKERQPSFFRRMFGGGSKNTVVAALDQSANLPPTASLAAAGPLHDSFAAPSPSSHSNNASYTNTTNNNNNNSNNNNNNNNTMNNHSPPTSAPSETSKASGGGAAPRQTSSSHGIQKKPSGFFRRRKKSISVNNVEPPPLPPTLPPAMIQPAELPPVPFKRFEGLAPKLEPSPVTSLRKAMDPYLKASESTSSSGRSTPRDDLALSVYHSAVEELHQMPAPADRSTPLRSFSPDYEPDPRATIRSVPPTESRARADNSPAPHRRAPETPSQNPTRPLYDYERSGSFLHDNSESDASPQFVRKQASQPAMTNRSRSPNPGGRLSLAPIETNTSSSSSNHNFQESKLNRLTRESMASDTRERPGSLTLPIEGFKTDYALKPRASAASIPDLRIDGMDPDFQDPKHPFDEPEFVVGEPTEDDKAKAQKIFDGSEDFIPKEKAASWMGEEGPIRQRTLQAYMDLYDFTNKSIVACLREVCNRLILRAETQQVDRILVCFSRRWCDCNPNHGFKSMDVVHTICYSIMLLNTDLHMADIEYKMTRSQFIKNTMTTVRHAMADLAPDIYDRPSILPGKGSTLDERRNSIEHERISFRNSFIKLPGRAGSALGDAPMDGEDCGPLVRSPFDGPLKSWEGQMEIVLKDIYASIRDERLPLYGAGLVQELPSAGGLSVMGMLKRSPSVLSKAPSEDPSARGRVGPESIRAGNPRWSSKSRSRPRGFGSAGFSSSRTSFDDGQSMWSPVDSVATWSRASLGRTHTSMSMDSFGSRFPRGDYQQSIGFANALSQAIIREDPRSSVASLVSDDVKATHFLQDESLELAGPPWVKEGIVIHKHHLDGVGKKAKDRNWTEVFAVVQKGNMSIFSFTPTKSAGRRNRNVPKKGAVVGGGNWQENATTLGTWNLRLALASTLPPPGYSKQRPHVWALSLPTGAVHLFHVGTPEICNEFVTTANYWSARLSTHPMIGGVSNMEYGWSDAIINNALVSAINETTASSSTAAAMAGVGPTGRQRSHSNAARSSMHSRGSSFRSVGSLDFGPSTSRSGSSLAAASNGHKLPGDKVTIAEWSPPTQSMRPSNSSEKDQLEILMGYVKSIEEELQQHNSLRSPMLLAFTPRGHNAQRAMANWERKSAYLLREIVKFRTYVDVLQVADVRKTEIYKEREVARRAARGSLDQEDRDRLSLHGSEAETGLGGAALADFGVDFDRGRLASRASDRGDGLLSV